MNQKNQELLFVSSGEAEQPFEWSAGKHISKLLAEMRDHKRLIASKCPQCQKVLFPPRRVCGDCFVEMDELVPISGRGVIRCFTVLNFGFVDPNTGLQKPVPLASAYIQLDGTETMFLHALEETDFHKIKIGMRVEPVWGENRKGHVLDIRHFKIIDQ